MNNRIEIPEELIHLIEKRETERRAAAVAPESDARAGMAEGEDPSPAKLPVERRRPGDRRKS